MCTHFCNKSNCENECTLAHRGCSEFPKHASSTSTSNSELIGITKPSCWPQARDTSSFKDSLRFSFVTLTVTHVPWVLAYFPRLLHRGQVINKGKFLLLLADWTWLNIPLIKGKQMSASISLEKWEFIQAAKQTIHFHTLLETLIAIMTTLFFKQAGGKVFCVWYLPIS